MEDLRDLRVQQQDGELKNEYNDNGQKHQSDEATSIPVALNLVPSA